MPPQFASRVGDHWVFAAFMVGLFAGWLNPTHHPPWTAFISEAPALAAGLLCVLIGLLRWQVAGVSAPPATIALGAVSAVPWLQWLAGQFTYAGDAWLASLYLGTAALCVWAGASAAAAGRTVALTEAIAWGLLAAAIASGAVALYQWFGLTHWGEWVAVGKAGTRPGGNVAQPNHLASLLLFGILATGYLWTRGKLGTMPAALTAGYLCLGMALAQSRTTWAASGALALVFLLCRRRLWHPIGVRLWIVAGLALFYAACFAAALRLPELLMVGAAGSEGRLGIGLRPLLWSQLAEAIRSSPWVGYGWLQGLTAQATAASLVPGREFASFSHNLVLDLVIWNGVPLALVLTLMLIAWYFRVALRADGARGAFSLSVITVFATHSMLEYPHAYMYFVVPVALLAGSLEFQDEAQGAKGAMELVLSPSVIAGFGGLVACVVIAVVVARDYVLAEQDRRDVQMVLLRIGGERPMPVQPDLWILDQLAAIGRASRLDITPKMTDDELASLRAVSRRYPSIFLLRAEAAALAMRGRQAEAVLVLRRLRGLHGAGQAERGLDWMIERGDRSGWSAHEFVAQARSELR